MRTPRQIQFLPLTSYIPLMDALVDSLKPLYGIMYHTGVQRIHLLNMEWSDVDFDAKQFRAAKHTIPFFGDIEGLLVKQFEVRNKECRKTKVVFFWHKGDLEGYHNDAPGCVLKNFYSHWRRATESVGFPGLQFQDLRCSALRNMVHVFKIDMAVASIMFGGGVDALFTRHVPVTAQEVSRNIAKLDTAFRGLRG